MTKFPPRLGKAALSRIAPPTGVSQYDLHSAVAPLGKATSATLSLRVTNGQKAVLKLPKNVLNDWLLVWKADSSNTANRLPVPHTPLATLVA
ncbi:MAG: DUF3122 domain-containing protein [Anaerolineae bacterium]|nr:DUF3122 domain-containing protein [Gloeobacterales cyanobacterium ES-bin-313]